MAKNISRSRKKPPAPDARNYKHPESTCPLRPDVGVQPQFKKSKPPTTYRYDSSLSPAMDWDGQNPAREVGQWLLEIIAEWGRAPSVFRWPQELKGMDGEVLHRLNNFHERWEQSAAYFLDTHPRVRSFVKNAGLGLAIPYLHNGQSHDYVPDFLVRLADGSDLFLILETKGYDPLKETKRQAALRWVAAVNSEGNFGHRAYVVVSRPEEVPAVIETALSTLSGA